MKKITVNKYRKDFKMTLCSRMRDFYHQNHRIWRKEHIKTYSTDQVQPLHVPIICLQNYLTESICKSQIDPDTN